MIASGGPSPNDDESDDRAAFAKSLDIAYQLIAVCATFSLPAVAGYFLDRWLGTVLLCTALGLAIGLVTSIYQFVKMVRRFESDQAKHHDSSDEDQRRD